jgi:DNA helicase II / ATP-dependent DNA helicase PcrA
MVLAGAGSGKTRVLTARIARLVGDGVQPRRILAVTFTNKAAGEMRERLGRLIGEAARAMWVGTFHGTCARLLRLYPDRVGLTRDFTIFDDDDQRRLISAILKELNVSERITPRAVLTRIDRARNSGEDLSQVYTRDYVDDVARRVAPHYLERLQRENAVDFNELLLKVEALTQHAEVGPELARRFEHVLVDEFQDTNPVQYRLVRHFSKGSGNLTVVGDDDQSIYRWRGAEPKNLLDFDRDFPEARVVKLEQNYRSTQLILAAANAVIAKNRERHAKRLWTDRGEGEPILVEECWDERAEAQFIAQGILGLRGAEGRGEGDFAVLYRTHAQSRALEEAFRAKRIPYRVVGGVSFFQRREIKDITEYLRLLANDQADTAFERVVNVPARGIGDTTVDRIRVLARARSIPMLEAARLAAAGEGDVTGAARKKLDAFLQLMHELSLIVRGGGPVANMVAQVIERTEYRLRLELEDSPESKDRVRNLNELVAAAAAYDAESGEGASLAGFTERIALTGGADEKDGRGECATLMTVHAAKGLEFPIVFLAGLEEGIFPNIRDDDDDRDLEEERRLAYVAITRAEQRLILTHAQTRRSYDGIRRNDPSRFLGDIPAEALAVRVRRTPTAPSSFQRPAARRPSDDDDYVQVASDDEPVYYVDDAPEADDPIFPRGASVRHKIYGVGTIEDGSGKGPDRKLVVRFPTHGVKTIIARFVERIR